MAEEKYVALGRKLTHAILQETNRITPFNAFQPRVTFHIETSNLICIAVIWFARCSHLISRLVGCAWWTGVSQHCDSDAKYEECTSWFLSQCSLITFYFWGKFHWWCLWRFSSFLPPHFWPMFSFHTSWKHQKIKGTDLKTKGILMFSGSMKWENYPEMG